MSFEEHVLRDLMNCPLKPASDYIGSQFVVLTREMFRQELNVLLGRTTYEFMGFGVLFPNDWEDS